MTHIAPILLIILLLAAAEIIPLLLGVLLIVLFEGFRWALRPEARRLRRIRKIGGLR